ncbi:uncharacterized protein K02A2.6-like [Amphibalanus amphitrite]|uniref:uncharacterized protein K02A2.6-like n=1 Tax=Amphibalanus amphitrite TaxID=1232801 RepID=UPI001C90B077|nr:uncharacterized protein K02A2.6-like [Amphibalanus amphitrite]
MAAPYLPSVRQFRKGEDFEVWMKSLEYYCLAIGAVEPERKKGLLLHLLGPEMQEIYETLPTMEERKVNTVNESPEVYDMYHMAEKAQPSYQVAVTLENEPVTMDVDTGAARSIMSYLSFKKMKMSKKMEPTSVILRSYGGQRLKVKGKVNVTVEINGQRKDLDLLLVEGDGPALMGRDWISALQLDLTGLISVVQSEEGGSWQVQELMNKYADLFSDKPSTCTFEARLQVDETMPAKFYKARPVPLAMKQLVEDEINRQVQKGVLEPVSHSEWAAPVVTIVKPDKKSVRLCGSYDLTVNQASRLERYPMPRTEELLTQLSGGQRFTKLDLKEAYLQLPLQEESRKYMVINTHKGLFMPKKLQYGVSSAPAICQRYMESLLAGIPHTVVFLDDVCITGKNQEEHLSNLEEVLRRLHDAGLRLNPKKCSWFQSEVQYLGFKVDSQGIHATEEKLKAIKEAPAPTNVHQLKSYLGLIMYYNKFMKNLSTVAEPLYRLLKKGQVWEWGKQQQASFNKTKELLCSAPCLTHYRASAPLVVSADASPVGVGAVLSIVDEAGEERPVAYASRSLNSTERNWSQLDREGLAIVFAVKKWHSFLLGRAGVTIKTDHRPLLALLGPDKQLPLMTSPRILRWRTILSAYQYTLVYSPAHKQRNSDGLSRNPLPLEDDATPPVPAETVMMLETLEKTLLKSEQIRKYTATDPVLSKVMTHVAQGWPDKVEDQLKSFQNRKTELSLEMGCLLWGNRVVVPEKLQGRLLRLLHDGHPGIGAMKATARSTVWWPAMNNAIENTVKCCERCQQHRSSAPPVEMRPWRIEDRPWTRLHLDYAGPIEGKWLLIVVDSTSKWIDAHVTSTPSATATISKLRVTFATHGLPSVVVTDNGTAFTSGEFAAFLRANGVRHLRTPAYHPSSNGQAEAAVKVVKEGLKKYVEGTLEVRLTRVLFKYRTTPHSTTRQTPAEVLMGRKLRTHLDLVFPDLRSTVEFQQDQQILRKKAQSRQFKIGDSVYVSEVGRGEPRWHAAVVTSVRSQLCELKLDDGRVFTRHIDHIRGRESKNEAESQEDRRPRQLNEEEEERLRQTKQPREEEERNYEGRREDETDQKSQWSKKTNRAEKVDEQTKQKKDERNMETEEMKKDASSNVSEPTAELNKPVGGHHTEEGNRGDAVIPSSAATAGDSGEQSVSGAHRYALRDRSRLRPPDRYGST